MEHLPQRVPRIANQEGKGAALPCCLNRPPAWFLNGEKTTTIGFQACGIDPFHGCFTWNAEKAKHEKQKADESKIFHEIFPQKGG